MPRGQSVQRIWHIFLPLASQIQPDIQSKQKSQPPLGTKDELVIEELRLLATVDSDVVFKPHALYILTVGNIAPMIVRVDADRDTMTITNRGSMPNKMYVPLRGTEVSL
jgi:hypothetical protein